MDIKSENINYLSYCNSLSPVQRVELGFELSEWAIKTNKHIDFLIKQSLSNAYVLK
jgi:hypothetical protein